MNLKLNSKERFTNRVDDYARYRPGYPRAVVDFLHKECGLTPESVIADIGSGTGLLAQLFLENGNFVYGVEPNAAMSQAGEEFLRNYPRFRSVAGSAEATNLPDATADFIIAGQAFHWFDRAASRREFARVLTPQGWVAVIWNERATDRTPFMRDYEHIMRQHSSGYAEIQGVYAGHARLADFFESGGIRSHAIDNQQTLDWEGIKGRLMSASYAPPVGDPRHEPMIEELKKVFDANQKDNRVTMFYGAWVHCGRVGNRAERISA